MKPEEKKNLIFAAVLVLLVIATGVVAWQVAAKDAWAKAFAAGQEAGKGQLKPAQVGTVYELKLVGVSLAGDEYYDMSGLTEIGNGTIGRFSLPGGVREGDRVSNISGREFTIVAR